MEVVNRWTYRRTQMLLGLGLLLFLPSCGLFNASQGEEPPPQAPSALEGKTKNLGPVIQEYQSLANDLADVKLQLHKSGRFQLVIDPLAKDQVEDAARLYGTWQREDQRMRLIFDDPVNKSLFTGTENLRSISDRQFVIPAPPRPIWIYGIQCAAQEADQLEETPSKKSGTEEAPQN